MGHTRDSVYCLAMLAQFRDAYPMGSVLTELLRVEEGIFIVKAQVMVNTITLGTGLAGASRVEEAEESALKRALIHAGFVQSSFKPMPTTYAPPGIPNPLSPGTLGAESNGSAKPPAAPPSHAPAPSPSPLYEPLAWTPPVAETKPHPPTDLSGDPEDVSDLIAQTSVEMERIGWTAKEGRECIREQFGKDSRSQLSPAELRQFLRLLQQKPPHLKNQF
ncbi:MAG: hypothetical protein OHK0012_18870 [Synechococcales cyanobacterium]